MSKKGSYRKLPGLAVHCSGSEGFTLLELLVVCALIGIVLSLAIPSMQTSLVTDPLKLTARKTIGMVREIREKAARTGQPYLLHINHIENSIWFEADTQNDNETTDEETSQDTLNLPEEIKISGLWVAGEKKSALENTTVWINPEGYMQNTVIRFSDDDDESLALEFQTFLDDAILHDKVPSQ